MQKMVDKMEGRAAPAIERYLNAEAEAVAARVAENEPWDAEIDGDALLSILADNVYRPAFMDFAGAAYGSAEAAAKAAPPETTATWLEEVLRIIGQVGARRVTQMTDTSRAFLRSIIEEAAADGVGVEEAARRVRSRMPEINRNRSLTIARTELNATASAGTFSGVQSAAADLDMDIQKVWYTSPDGRVRDSHAAANGQKVPLDELFNVGGSAMQHPGDFNAPAAEVVNCRCTMLYEEA